MISMTLLQALTRVEPREFFLVVDTRSNPDQIQFELNLRNATNMAEYHSRRVKHDYFNVIKEDV